MCFIFHKWTRWSDPYATSWVSVSPLGEHKFTKTFQNRSCHKCGKTQRREVNAE